MRKLVRGLFVLLLSVPAIRAHADDPTAAARRLTVTLLHTKPSMVPAGLSSPSITPMPSTENDGRAGIVGAVKMSLSGRASNAEIRYAVFANPADAHKYSTNFASSLTAS